MTQSASKNSYNSTESSNYLHDVERLFSKRAKAIQSSAIREILKVTERPEVISFAGGLPSAATFPEVEMQAAFGRVFAASGREALQYSTTEGYKPFAAMRQIWNASHGGQGDQLDQGEGLLTLWWTTWLISNIASNISFRLSMNPDSVEQLTLGQQIGAFAALVSLALYPAAYRLVDRITAAQRERLSASHIFS